MDKYIAVIVCDDKIQLVIPVKWYGVLDCNGYNRGINRSVKRRIFFSPFGDDIEPDFDLPISPLFRRNANACYQVYFLQVCYTKAECLQFVTNRRVTYPAVYNEGRLREYIPDPRLIRHRSNRGTTNSRRSIAGVGVADESESDDETEPYDTNDPTLEITEHNPVDNIDAADANKNGPTSAGRNIDANILHESSANAAGGDSTAASHNIVAEISHRITVNATARTSTGAGRNIVAEMNEPAINASPIASTSASARNGFRDGFQFEADRIKQEIKIELRNRLLEANMQSPLVDLTNDQEEELAPTAAAETGANAASMDHNAVAHIERNTFASASFGHYDVADVLHGPTMNAPAVASTSASLRNDFSDGFQFEADRVKHEIKIELRNRLLESNERNPVVNLSNDPEEVAAFAAVENNFHFDDSDSDDDMQLLADLVTSNAFVPVQIKFEFDGNDLLSGDIPFVTDVS